MKTNGDCCMVALRKQHELLLQHITKLRLSDHPFRPKRPLAPLLRSWREKNSLTPSTSAWCSVQWQSAGCWGDPLLQIVPPSLFCFSPLATQGWHWWVANFLLMQWQRSQPLMPKTWLMFPQVNADPILLLCRAKGGPAVALLTGRPTAVQERYVFWHMSCWGVNHAEVILGWWRIVWLPSGCDKGVMTGGCCWGVGLLLLWMSWLESLPSCSELASDFNTAFSRSKTEFLSYSSLMCSFNTSTSSRTAYIRWLFTKSWTKKINFKHRKFRAAFWSHNYLMPSTPNLRKRIVQEGKTSE